MSFNLYFAGSQAKEVDEYIQQIHGCRLFSFADKSLKMFEDYRVNNPQCKLFMDSGAFSIFHNDAKINIDEYVEFINNTDGVEVWAQLDDIPFPVLNSETSTISANGSWEKYQYLMSKVKDERKDHVIPIYHFGEPYSALERILNTEVEGRLAPYIGVGGRHGVSKKAHYDYFKTVFSIIKKSKNPNVKVHAFGMTVLELLESFPFYSADSTTWLMLGVNGNIMTKTCGCVCVSDRQTADKKHAFHLQPQVKDKVEQELSVLGYTLEEVSTDYKKRLKVNITYFKNWADNFVFKGTSTVKRRKLI